MGIGHEFRSFAVDNQMELGIGCIGTASVFCVEMQDKVAGSDPTNSSIAFYLIGNRVSELEIFCPSFAYLIIDCMHYPLMITEIPRMPP